jgi:hypothetical protein
MLYYIKRLTATLNRLYIKVQFASIHKTLARLEKKYTK